MSLIFDKFPSTESAEAFVTDIRERYKLDGKVYATQDESDRDDPFPYTLVPPIVLIARSESERLESRIEEAVETFGGEFAGT